MNTNLTKTSKEANDNYRIWLQIGSRLRKLRDSFDMTQFAFGKLLGISAGYLSAIERGERKIPLQVAFRVHEVTNVSYDYLFDGTSVLDVVYSDYLMEPHHPREACYQKMLVVMKTCSADELAGIYELANCYLKTRRRTGNPPR